VSNVSFSSTSYAKVDTNVVFTVLFPDRDSTAKNKSIMEYLLPKLYNKFDIAPEELPITIEQINALSDDLYRADKTSNPDMVYYAKMILTDIMLEYKYRKSTNTLKNFKITTQLVRNLYDIPDDIPKIHSIKPGVVCGLAVNNASASVDYIECTKYKSKNDYIKFSGQGHDSSAIDAVNDAYAYIRTNAEQFKLNPENFVGNQLYFKFFGGGNSLGTLATTAILSCFKQIIVSSDICMTGVVDINGDVKAIGRVDEKIKAAIANNMKVIYVPFENKNEALKSLSKEQLNKVKVIYVKTYMEIYKDIFGDK
jgi:ATP-dependent Lon protease